MRSGRGGGRCGGASDDSSSCCGGRIRNCISSSSGRSSSSSNRCLWLHQFAGLLSEATRCNNIRYIRSSSELWRQQEQQQQEFGAAATTATEAAVSTTVRPAQHHQQWRQNAGNNGCGNSGCCCSRNDIIDVGGNTRLTTKIARSMSKVSCIQSGNQLKLPRTCMADGTQQFEARTLYIKSNPFPWWQHRICCHGDTWNNTREIVYTIVWVFCGG